MSVNLNFPNIVGTDTSDATATESDIAVGKTAYVNGVKVTGTKDWVDTSDATATASDIAVGKTAYVNGTKVTGTKEEVSQNIEFIDDISNKDGSDSCPGVVKMLKSISIPDGNTQIPTSAFNKCTNLERVTIPDSVTIIKNYAFWGCSSLKSVTIGCGVTSIENYIFKNCSNLAHVYYKGTKEQWDAISNISGWKDGAGSNVPGGTVIHYNS